MGRMVALLRAVNVGGRKLPMAELRTLCAGLGWSDVATYIQSGNVVFTAPGKPEAIEAVLEKAIEKQFGLDVPVIVRSQAEWAEYPGLNPFPEAAGDEPNKLHVLLVAKRPPAKDAAEAIQARAEAGERVRQAGDALWFHYPEGAGTSKLTPSLIDRAIGSPGTARNFNTVMKLQGDAGGMTDTPLIPRKYWAIAFGIVAVMAAIELAMGRHAICTCGTVKLFVATVHGPDNSQHIADWYTPSHIIHGFLFYLLGWLVLRNAARPPAAPRRLDRGGLGGAREQPDHHRPLSRGDDRAGLYRRQRAQLVDGCLLDDPRLRHRPAAAGLGDGRAGACVRAADPDRHPRQSVPQRADAGLAGGRDPGLARRDLMRRLLLALPLLVPSPALAQELFGGVLAHDVHLPIDKGGFENGVDLELGWRGGRIRALHVLGSPSPYVLASVVPSGGTHFAAAGLSWRIGRGPVFLRPGAGPRHQ